MGCIFCKIEEDGTSDANTATAGGAAGATKTVYSWDLKPRIDPKDFTVENLNNETVIRLPKSIDGQQFIIRDCKNAKIYLFDHINTISVDDCENCVIYIAVVKTSVFVRDCTNCRIAVACQQFRTRDCLKLDVFLCCVSQPIIEASSRVRFAPLQINYPQLESQFMAAGLSPFNCEWSDIHDFTPVSDDKNYSLTSGNVSLAEFFNSSTERNQQEFLQTVQFEKENSLIPLTLGQRNHGTEESCLIVFFKVDHQRPKIREILRNLLQSHTDLQLARSRELRMTPSDGERIFGCSDYGEFLSQGTTIVGFEVSGSQAVTTCRTELSGLLPNPNDRPFISESVAKAKTQLDQFYSFINMQMNSQ